MGDGRDGKIFVAVVDPFRHPEIRDATFPCLGKGAGEDARGGSAAVLRRVKAVGEQGNAYLTRFGYKVFCFENKMVFEHLPSVLQEIKASFKD